MLNLPKYVFLNGPPGSGKSTLATLLCNVQQNVWPESFAEPIRQMVYSVFFADEGPISFSFDLRDGEVKKRDFPYPSPDGAALSFRSVMISFSEHWMKPRFGQDIFGKLALSRCREQELYYETFLFDDSEFAPEAKVIINEVGAVNCLLIRLHRTNCSFAGDSRNYISLPEVPTIDLENNGTPQDMLAALQLSHGNL